MLGGTGRKEGVTQPGLLLERGAVDLGTRARAHPQTLTHLTQDDRVFPLCELGGAKPEQALGGCANTKAGQSASRSQSGHLKRNHFQTSTLVNHTDFLKHVAQPREVWNT